MGGGVFGELLTNGLQCSLLRRGPSRSDTALLRAHEHTHTYTVPHSQHHHHHLTQPYTARRKRPVAVRVKFRGVCGKEPAGNDCKERKVFVVVGNGRREKLISEWVDHHLNGGVITDGFSFENSTVTSARTTTSPRDFWVDPYVFIPRVRSR